MRRVRGTVIVTVHHGPILYYYTRIRLSSQVYFFSKRAFFLFLTNCIVFLLGVVDLHFVMP